MLLLIKGKSNMKTFYNCFKYLVVAFALSGFLNLYGQWTQTSYSLSKPSNHLIVVGNNLFCATDTFGVYLSTDNGSNWMLQQNNTGTDFFNVIEFLSQK
jgi:hypothetical protein